MRTNTGLSRWLLAAVVMLTVIATAGLAQAWNLTGSPITNNSGRTGRMYFSVVDQYGNAVAGASVPSGGSSGTIRGVPDGNYSVKAYVDTTGTGFQHANDPSFSSGPFFVSGDSTGPVVFSNHSSAALVAPDKPGIMPLDSAAFVNIDPPTTSDNLPIADKYNIYWSTSSNPGPGNTVGGGSLLNITAKKPKIVVYNLTNGSTLYFSVAAVSNGGALALSPVSDPVTINGPPPGSGSTVSFAVDTTGIAKGSPASSPTPLLVALSNESDKGKVYFSYVKYPTDVQTVQVPGVSAGLYKIYAVLDLDGNGNIDALLNPSTAGDADRNQRGVPIAVDGVTPSLPGPTLKLAAKNAAVSVRTSHQHESFGPNQSSDNYNLSFIGRQMNKRVVGISLDSGPQISGPIDLPTSNWSDGAGEFESWQWIQNRPSVGDTYSFTVNYADGTAETKSAAVTAVLDQFPGEYFPIGITGPDSVAPTFGFNTAANYPGFVTSQVYMNGFSAEFLPLTVGAVPYQGSPLWVGQQNNWTRTLQDIDGNQTQSSYSFTPNGSGPQIQNFTPQSGLAGTPITVTVSGFNPTSDTYSVSIGGKQVAVTSSTANSVTVAAPAASGLITINANGVTAASAAPFAASVNFSVTLTEGVDGTTPLTAATVSQVLDPSVATTANTAGVYLLPVPAGPAFSMLFAQSGHYPTSTSIMNVGGASSGGFSLYTASDLSARNANPQPGKGLIYSRVQDATANTNANMAGVVVTATSLLHPDTPYTVMYTNGSSNVAQDPAAFNQTSADGRYYVPNVDEGDWVTVTASKNGMAFNSKVFNTHGGMVFQGGLKGATVSAVTANPPGGLYTSPQTVTLTATANDNIYYTLDGSDPTMAGTLYSAPITVQPDTTLRFVAKNKYFGLATGSVQTAIYSSGGQSGYANGTYSYDQASSTVTLNFTEANFCNGKGPSVGTETDTITSLTPTSMTWASGDSPMTWTTSGWTGNLVGTWNLTDGSSGNLYQATFNNDGTVNVTGIIFNCGGTNNGPQSPYGVYASAVSPSQVYVSWIPSSDPGVTSYTISRDSGQGPVPVATVSGQNVSSWTDNSVTTNANYSYAIAACYSSNNCSMPSQTAQVTVPGMVPSTASGTYSYSASTLTMNWTDSSFPCNGPQVGTNDTKTITTPTATTMVWSDSDGPMTWTRSSGTPGSVVGTWSTTDSSGSTYSVTFTAAPGGDGSQGTLSVSGSVFCGGGSNSPPPAMPSGLSANVVGPGQVSLTWSPSTDIPANGSYQLYRSDAQHGQTMIGQIWPMGMPSWFDNMVAPNTTYTYSLAACNGNQPQACSQTVSFTVSTPPAVPVSLSWGAVYHQLRNDGFEYDVLDVGVNSYAGTLAGAGVASITVTGPNGFFYNFTDADKNAYPNGQLALARSAATSGPDATKGKLPFGVYTVTLTDTQGNLSHRMSTYVVPPSPLPQVDASTIQYQRKADGSYRFSWAPVNDSKSYYYRLKVSFAPQNGGGSFPLYNSTREATTFADLPAGMMPDGASMQARVEVFDAPTIDLTTNRSDSAWMNFMPQQADYNPGKVLVNYASMWNLANGASINTQVGLSVSNYAAVTLLELRDAGNNLIYTFNTSTDVTKYTGNLAGTQFTTDFFKQLSTPLAPGPYKFHLVANGIDQYAYATLTPPVSYPAVDPTTMQAEELGNGSVRFSWANVNHVGAIYYRISVQDTVTFMNLMTARSNQAYIDLPKANLGSNPVRWRVEVHDSPTVNTLRNRSNSLYVTNGIIPYDPARALISGFRVRNMTKSSGANVTHLGLSAVAQQSTLASIVVSGPNGYSRDLMSAGRFSTDLNNYFLEEAGSPVSGLYTFTVTTAAGKSSTRYLFQPAAHPVPAVDFRNFHIDSEPNGDVRLSWAPVASDVPLWYQVAVFAQNDMNGDGLIDRTYTPYILKDTNNDGIAEHVNIYQQASLTIPASDLPGIVTPNMFLVRSFDGSESSVINNYSQSVMVGSGPSYVGFNYATLNDNDNDGWASDIDGNDSDPSAFPFSGGNGSLMPSVSSTTPAWGSNNSSVIKVSAVFNKVIDQRTLAGNFTLSNGVTGTVSYDPGSRTASFLPSAPLASGFTYTAYLSGGIKDEAGNFVAPFSWSFSVGGGGTPPSVSLSMPTTSNSLTVPLSIGASPGVVAFCLTQNSDSTTCSWYSAPFASYNFSSYGFNTLYVYGRDGSGMVSPPASGTVNITENVIPASVSLFLPQTSNSLTVQLSLGGTGVVSYCLTESGDAATCNWNTSAPMNYTFSGYGTKTLYAYGMGTNGIVTPASIASVSITQAPSCGGAHHWTQLPGGTSPTIMHLAGGLTINGRPANACDEIAAFDSKGNLVGFFYVQNEGQFGDMVINGDASATTGVDEGATAGEKLTLKVWDGTQQQEFGTPSVLWLSPSTSVPGYTNYQGPLTFAADSMQVMDVIVTQGVATQLNAGWNMVGWTTKEGYFDVTTDPMAGGMASNSRMSAVASKTIGDIFGTMGLTSADSFVSVGPDGVVFTPGSPFNTLKKLVPGKGYWVYLPTSKTVTVPGDLLSPTDQLPLTQGWNQIGYWGVEGAAPATALGCLNGQYDVVVDEAGKVYVAGSPFNTLKNMHANRGYFIHTTGPVTLTYQCQ